jgi:uncharacterized membrane protein YdjX (TVP38/TMEM64 family)
MDLCMLPGTILYVVGADAFTRGIAEGEIPWGLIAIVAGVAALLTILVRQARKKLHESETKSEDAPSKEDSGTGINI